MTNLKTVLAVAVGSLFAGAAFAQSNFSIEQRDRIQDSRIERGVESGQLTGREAARLEAERGQVERLERRARADGVVTNYERNRIDHAQDRLSRDIRRESNDRQVARDGWRGSERPHGWDRRVSNDHRRDARFDRFSHNDGVRGQHNSHVNNPSTHTGFDGRFGRSDASPGRQWHQQQSGAQSDHVQQAQTQRTWTRPAQSGGSATTGGSTTASTSASVGRSGGFSRPATSTGAVTVARAGGYTGRHTR